ncbi:MULTISPECIES: LysR family substrate-binding domain-containing protein [unclassified Rhodococcus (in: high G+C Gram-positive bacteria)]|uniref:LysR family substrate-binding domain-containing protein n=1 Tax=unclassified Rhodococcus (in: high G+C Gram-positive bacteria) TaxID=192944 RepID=UPI00163A3005|nr:MULTISPECIES: LysR family substrate-binding domain-containing protein [unclassified Rhodococcus (in: high G+C Gram-positive bacteria)]MBC2643907.1 LysR family substrate-binding domain-containing protein [Rhodococcus sp. 3A]MBC2891353.1 LysR family substrate-binding domain-containing protein [Rhodococcus sp. 4CII]
MTDADASPSFRLAYVPGVTPTKWVRIWNERLPDVPLALVAVSAAEAPDRLRGGGADAGLVRLPIDRTGLSAIPLYTEIPVVVAPKDHVVAAVDEVSIADLDDEIVLRPLDDPLEWDTVPGRPAQDRPETTSDAIELVAAGIGLLVVPQSLARLHHRKDLIYRTVTDGPESRIALSWPEDETTDLVEEFIGIVRGRTVNSSRGRTPTPAEPKKKRPAAAAPRQKPAAGAKTSRSGSGTKGGKRGKPRRRS